MRIVIVGGGTAGWLSALMIKKITKNMHEITLVESSSIGIIGAGEGSTGFLRGILTNQIYDFGCNEIDFLKSANGTIKLGIEHTNWSGDKKTYFAPIDQTSSSEIDLDDTLSFCIANNIPFHMSTIAGQFLHNNLSSFYEENGNIYTTDTHAYHFDGNLASKYFEKICGTQVKKIDAKVLKINLDNINGNVKSILLDNNTEIFGDFFIDASGFARIFMKELEVKWISYGNELLANSAMPFSLEYDEEEIVKPVTKAIAKKYGWMWMIPKINDYGCGYVFNNNYISFDEAKNEIEKDLNKEIKVIKEIKFDPGRMSNAWNKNVLSIGISSSFLEPLEATNIHSTITQLSIFIFQYLKETKEETLNPGSIYLYNKRINEMYDDFKNFILLHYSGNSKSTNFWEDANAIARKNEYVDSIIKSAKDRLVSPNDIDTYYACAGSGLYNWILCGLNHYSAESAKKELKLFNGKNRAESSIKELTDIMMNKNWITNNNLNYALKNNLI